MKLLGRISSTLETPSQTWHAINIHLCAYAQLLRIWVWGQQLLTFRPLETFLSFNYYSQAFFFSFLTPCAQRGFGQLPGLADVQDSKQNCMQWIAINICCIVISLICSALKHDKQTNFCWPTEQKFKKMKHFKREMFSHSYRENWMDCLLAGRRCLLFLNALSGPLCRE